MSNNSHQLYLNSLEESNKFASLLATYLSCGDVICLEGTLGAGKTTFSQMVINHYMGKDMHVTSPTFTLVQHYEEPNKTPIWHCDFYRLKDESELVELGIDDALEDAITLIEWPEIAYNYLPENRLRIHFNLINNPDNETFTREVTFNTNLPLGYELAKEVNKW